MCGMPLRLRSMSRKSAVWLNDAAAGGGGTIAAEWQVYLEKTADNEYCKERTVRSVETLYRQRVL